LPHLHTLRRAACHDLNGIIFFPVPYLLFLLSVYLSSPFLPELFKYNFDASCHTVSFDLFPCSMVLIIVFLKSRSNGFTVDTDISCTCLHLIIVFRPVPGKFECNASCITGNVCIGRAVPSAQFYTSCITFNLYLPCRKCICLYSSSANIEIQLLASNLLKPYRSCTGISFYLIKFNLLRYSNNHRSIRVILPMIISFLF